MVKHSEKALRKWKKVVDDFTTSNLSPKEYCKRTGVNINTLYTWRYRFGTTGIKNKAVTSTATFREIEFSNEAVVESDNIEKSYPPIEVDFSDKVKLKLYKDCDEQLLQKTVQILAGVLC
jgi:hypothetical protein